MPSDEWYESSDPLIRQNKGLQISEEGSTPWNGPPLCGTLSLENLQFYMRVTVTGMVYQGTMQRTFDLSQGASVSLDCRGMETVKVYIDESYDPDTQQQGIASMMWRDGVRNYSPLRRFAVSNELAFTECPRGAAAIVLQEPVEMGWSDDTVNPPAPLITWSAVPGQIYPVMGGVLWTVEAVAFCWYLDPW